MNIHSHISYSHEYESLKDSYDDSPKHDSYDSPKHDSYQSPKDDSTKHDSCDSPKGDSYKAGACGTAGRRWIKIDQVDGTSVKDKYGVKFAYAAAGFFR